MFVTCKIENTRLIVVVYSIFDLYVCKDFIMYRIACKQTARTKKLLYVCVFDENVLYIVSMKQQQQQQLSSTKQQKNKTAKRETQKKK